MNIREIQELRVYLTDSYHAKRVKEQEEDQRFIDDNIPVPDTMLPAGSNIVKTGKAYRMVAAPAEHIVSRNPKVFREAEGKGTEQARRVASECNQWATLMTRANPQPFKEHVKKLLGKGEAWIYVIHNEDYNPEDYCDMPVQFLIPDPTIVFVDPEAGERNGVPNRAIIYTMKYAAYIKHNYPDWAWTKQAGRNPLTTTIPFLLYFDNDKRYFEADSDALLLEGDGTVPDSYGIQDNVYGFVPMVHCYSGFGEGTPDGDPASLAVSRIRNCRGLLQEYTAIRSAINTLIFKYAYPPLNLLYNPAEWTPPADFAESYDRSLGSFNTLPITTGGKLEKGVDMLPDQQLFTHLYNIERNINQEDPLGTIGQAMGTSGRQQLDAESGALRRYDTVVDNCSNAFSEAFGLALRMIEKIPSIKPEHLKENDIGGNYEVRLELKADDPVASQIKSEIGNRMWAAGAIDSETNLVEYQGKTVEEAQKIIGKTMVDKITLNDPIIMRLMAIQVAREMGMEEQYTALEAQFQDMEKSLKQGGAGSQGGEPRVNNIQTQRGLSESDMALSPRPTRMSPGLGME